MSYDDFASEKITAKVTFKDRTAKTLTLYAPSQTLHGTQRVELVKKDDQHIMRFYPVVYLKA